jgi:L-histidine N-alpha-methyltransferase
VHPVVADFTQPFDLAGRAEGSTTHLGFFPGSTIGNFEPAEAVTFLRRARTSLRFGSRMLLGADLVKDIAVLRAAYDDAAGVTAAFNLNVLTSLNREAGADFDLSGFRHEARWNAVANRIEMHWCRGARSPRGWPAASSASRQGKASILRAATNTAPSICAPWRRPPAGRRWHMWTDPEDMFSVWLLEN